MARIFTTPEAEKTAKAYLHDLTLAAGLRSTSQRSSQHSFHPEFIKHATALCDELVNRDFANVDADIRWLSGMRFNADLSGKTHTYKSYKPEGIAKCLVYMAELLSLYWDDTVRTPYEVDEFKKSLLGEMVYKYGRYISAIKDKTGKSRGKASAGPSVANATGGTGVATPSASQQPKTGGYKQSGPQSGNVRDLRDQSGVGAGNAGEKFYADGPFIYKIIGDNPQSKNTPNVFIKPLSASGAAAGGTNKIFFSSGNGYTDCTCYFDDSDEAQLFLAEIQKNNRVPANITNARVVKNKADSNGYFIVGTEFGICAISAKTLNEALVEAINEEVDRPVNWEKATESYTKEELDELHTWMRRG
jgi:hypothetical protein